MKRTLLVGAVFVFAPAILSNQLKAEAAASAFQTHLGLQMWSLRTLMLANPVRACDLVRHYGMTEVETAGSGRLSASAYAALLRARNITAIGGHFGYDQLTRDFPGVVRDAKALGLTYVICPSIPHLSGGFTDAAARTFAAQFNAWGRILLGAGLHFGYHTHGAEFNRPSSDGDTGFDTLVRHTDPSLVCYEMDVFWVYQAGQDPVALLARYPGRWLALHLKDLRRGIATPVMGKITAMDDVPVGLGQIDWPAVIGEAEKTGVRYYFIEDETADPLRSIPLSLSYLRHLWCP